MAAEPTYATTDPNKNAMDYAAHADTYEGFIALTKVATIGCILVVFALLLVYWGWPVTAILLSLGTLVGCIVALVIKRSGA